jgi:hypothetical protein
MSSNTTTNTPKETTPEITSNVQSSSHVQHVNMTTTPLNVDPVSIVFPDETISLAPVIKKEKSLKKGSKSYVKKKASPTSAKKSPKLKKGESKIPLMMEDLYLKKNPFNVPAVGSNVESSTKESEDIDIGTTKVDNSKTFEETSFAADRTYIFEKGNTIETLKSDAVESSESLGLDDKNVDKNDVCDNVNFDSVV